TAAGGIGGMAAGTSAAGAVGGRFMRRSRIGEGMGAAGIDHTIYMLGRIGKTGSGGVYMWMAADAVRRDLAGMGRYGRRIAMAFGAVGGRVAGQEGRTPRWRQDRRSRFIQGIAMTVRRV